MPPTLFIDFDHSHLPAEHKFSLVLLPSISMIKNAKRTYNSLIFLMLRAALLKIHNSRF